MLSDELRLEKQSASGYNTSFLENAASRCHGTPWSHGGNNKPARGRGRTRKNKVTGNQHGGFTNNSYRRGGGSSSTSASG
jgi:hypothetical protein